MCAVYDKCHPAVDWSETAERISFDVKFVAGVSGAAVAGMTMASVSVVALPAAVFAGGCSIASAFLTLGGVGAAAEFLSSMSRALGKSELTCRKCHMPAKLTQGCVETSAVPHQFGESAKK